jgi:regulator of sigma E protease
VSGTPDFSQVAGPIGIVSYGGTALKEGASEVLVLAASISIALGLFNLLPIPGLDGGRLFIVLIEGIFRRRVPPRIITGLTLGGFALLVVLMLVVSYHDVIKLVG